MLLKNARETGPRLGDSLSNNPTCITANGSFI